METLIRMEVDKDQYSDPDYGVGEKFLESVLRDINSYVKQTDARAPIFLACLNPLLQKYFDIVRLGKCLRFEGIAVPFNP